ncbi:hypothetical protein ID866_12182 [Astraeus odoratus]|nr:hypothetical protein ID866_12182 [Astraeus odoratus]
MPPNVYVALPSCAVLALRYLPPFLTTGRSHQLLIYIIQRSCDVIDLSPEKPSFRSCVGMMMRHSSTAFSIPGRSGSGTPPPRDSGTAFIAGSVSGKHDRDGSTSSLNKLQPPTSIRTRPVHSKPHPGVPRMRGCCSPPRRCFVDRPEGSFAPRGTGGDGRVRVGTQPDPAIV